MPIELKEFVGYTHVYTNAEKPTSLKENAMPAIVPQMLAPDSLMVDIEGIHEVLTVNNNLYEADCLKKSVPRWTYPYERPVIMHHNEEDGTIIGRIKKAEFLEKSSRTNGPGLLFTTNIGNPKGIEGVKNGTLATVSIGAIVYDLRCSICGKNLAEEGECEHRKGVTYDDKLCYWIVKDMEPKELSYVIVPSDKYAHNVKVYKPELNNLKESVEVNKDMSILDGIINLMESDESENLETKEAVKIDEEIKKDDEVNDKPEGQENDSDKENKKDEENLDNKDEETSNKEDETDDKDASKGEDESGDKDNKDEGKDEDKSEDKEKIAALEKEVSELKAKIEDLTASLSKTKKAKESVDAELVKYKVQEKTQVANNIISIRESLGMPCDTVEDMANNSTLKELNIMYNTLKEASEIKVTNALPSKILKESLVDNDNDNIVKSTKESSNISNVDDAEMEFNYILSKLIK